MTMPTASQLAHDLRAGTRDPVDLVAEVFDRISAHGDAALFVRQTCARAEAEARAAREQHEAAMRAADEAQARYERDMADWRATAAACQRGDTARCNAGRQPPH